VTFYVAVLSRAKFPNCITVRALPGGDGHGLLPDHALRLAMTNSTTRDAGNMRKMLTSMHSLTKVILCICARTVHSTLAPSTEDGH